MTPTKQNNSPQDKRRPQRPAEKKSDLVCNVKYRNTLPDIPFDLKFIRYPFNPNRFIEYKPTSLERSYKFETLTDRDLGLSIDLVNKDKYKLDCNAQMDPADEKLMEEINLVSQDSERSKHHATSVSWLRRTEYISTEQTRFQPQTIDKVEAKVGFSIKKNFKEETLLMDRESQLKAIEKTFEDNKKPIDKHYSKPNVYAVESLDVFPDFKNWKYPCAQVIFDSDPAPKGKPGAVQIEEMSQAMIRGVMDESGEQFVAHFLPTEETVVKRREDVADNRQYDDDYEYEYKLAREYNWNVKSKSSKDYEENFFLNVRSDGVFYNELETRVRLSKRRQKIGVQSSNINTKLIVRHVPINEQEFSVHEFREKQLQPYDEEEEAKAEGAVKQAMRAAEEDAKKLTSKNQTDSVDDDSMKGNNKKNDSVSKVSSRREISDEEDNAMDKESSKSGGSEDGRQVNYVSSEAETSAKKNQKHAVTDGNSKSSVADDSDQEGNRGSDSD